MGMNTGSANSRSLTISDRFDSEGVLQQKQLAPIAIASTPGYAGLSGAAVTTSPHTGGSLEARLLRRLLGSLGDPPIEFELPWTGERVAPNAIQPHEHVRISDRRSLFGLLRDPHVRFGDAYSTGQIAVEGDLVKFMVTLFQIFDRPGPHDSIARRIAGWLYRPRRNTLAGSRDNIHRL